MPLQEACQLRPHALRLRKLRPCGRGIRLRRLRAAQRCSSGFPLRSERLRRLHRRLLCRTPLSDQRRREALLKRHGRAMRLGPRSLRSCQIPTQLPCFCFVSPRRSRAPLGLSLHRRSALLQLQDARMHLLRTQYAAR